MSSPRDLISSDRSRSTIRSTGSTCCRRPCRTFPFAFLAGPRRTSRTPVSLRQGAVSGLVQTVARSRCLVARAAQGHRTDSGGGHRDRRGTLGRLQGTDGCDASEAAAGGGARRPMSSCRCLSELIKSLPTRTETTRDPCQDTEMKRNSPVGTTTAQARSRRGQRRAYRAEQERLAPFEELARLIIKHRAALGISQEELARRVGTSHSAISRIESGRHKTSVETLQRLARALEVRLVVGFESGPVERPVRELVSA